MTPNQAREIMLEIRQKAEDAFAKSGERQEVKHSYMLGCMEVLFEETLKKLIYESTHDN